MSISRMIIFLVRDKGGILSAVRDGGILSVVCDGGVMHGGRWLMEMVGNGGRGGLGCV